MQTNRGMQRSPKETESASRADDWFSTKCSKKIKLNVLRMCLKELQCQKDPGWSLAQGISKPLVSQQSLSNEVPRCQDSAGKQHVRKIVSLQTRPPSSIFQTFCYPPRVHSNRTMSRLAGLIESFKRPPERTNRKRI